MPNVKVSYYVWKVGAKRKSPQPKFDAITEFVLPGAEGSFVPLVVPEDMQGFPLAFVSVSGSANGHYIIGDYPNPSYTPIPSDPPPEFQNPPPSFDDSLKINVGKTNVTVSIWYVPLGGRGSKLGAYIDSFNVDTGEFFFDPNVANDFVTISPDAGLTAVANEFGFVPTTSAETITSKAKILNIPFLKWIVMSSSGKGFKPVINGKDLQVSANTNVYAIAYFGTQNNNKKHVKFIDFYEAISKRLYPGEEVDAPKPGNPDPPQWRISIKQLAVLATMHESIDMVVREHRSKIQSKIASLTKDVTNEINKAVR